MLLPSSAQLQFSLAEAELSISFSNSQPPTQPPTQPGKYQASKIKQSMLNGSCQSLGVKLKTVFGPNLNNLNSSLKAIINSENGKFNESQFNIACTSSLLLYMLISKTILDPFQLNMS